MGKLEGPVDVAVLGPRAYWTRLEAKGAVVALATDVESGRIVWRRTVQGQEPSLGEPIP